MLAYHLSAIFLALRLGLQWEGELKLIIIHINGDDSLVFVQIIQTFNKKPSGKLCIHTGCQISVVQPQEVGGWSAVLILMFNSTAPWGYHGIQETEQVCVTHMILLACFLCCSICQMCSSLEPVEGNCMIHLQNDLK